MEKNYKSTLQVNNRSIDLNEFVEQFLARVTVGAVTTLKGVDYLKKIEVTQDKGEVKVMVNGDDIRLTAFPNDVIANTLAGLVSTLKGVDKSNIKNIHVVVEIP